MLVGKQQVLQKVPVQSAARTFSASWDILRKKMMEKEEGHHLKGERSSITVMLLIFYFLLPINTTFSTSWTLSIIFHLFVFIRHTSNICHISFFLLLAWPLSRPFSLSVGLNHPLTPLQLGCNVSGPGLLLLASAAGSAPNAIVRLILSLCFSTIYT